MSAAPCDMADNQPYDIKQGVIDVMRGFGFDVIEKSDFEPGGPARVYGTIDNAACLIEHMLVNSTPQWISTAVRLPEERDRSRQLLTCATKNYPNNSNYPGQGIKGVNQDWVVRLWPQNFTHWAEIGEIA